MRRGRTAAYGHWTTAEEEFAVTNVSSCDGASTTFTGMQLVTETVPHGGAVDEPPDCTGDLSGCVEDQASATATVAFLAALLGSVLGAFGLRRGPGWAAAAGLAATLWLGAIALAPFGPDVAFRSGYRLALLFFVWATSLHARRAWRRRRERRREREVTPGPSALVPAPPAARQAGASV